MRARSGPGEGRRGDVYFPHLSVSRSPGPILDIGLRESKKKEPQRLIAPERQDDTTTPPWGKAQSARLCPTGGVFCF
jgi:hypothetical protein